jgi:hypothetical protein
MSLPRKQTDGCLFTRGATRSAIDIVRSHSN